MVAFKSDGIFSKEIFVVFRCCVLLLVANYQCSTEAIFMWTAPPPAWNQTETGNRLVDIQTAVYPVRNGRTNVILRWNYTLLPGQTVDLTTFSIGDGIRQDDIGLVNRGPTGTPNNEFKDLYSIYSTSQFSNLTINNVTEQENATFQCKLQVSGDVWAYNIRVEVTVPVLLTKVSDSQLIVPEGSNTTLLCEASGQPKPDVTLTRVLEDGGDGQILSAWNFPNINRTAAGTYRCTAKNTFEIVSQVFKVNVTYPAKIVKLVNEHNVASHQSVSLVCQAEGNPQPTYSWTPCGSKQSVCHKSVLHFQVSNKSVYTFTCKVENYLGSDTRNTTLFVASDVINVTMVITGEDCTDGENNQLSEKLSKMIEKIFSGKLGYERVQLKSSRSGSVDLALEFNSTVRESEVLCILKDAIKNEEFGECNVTAVRGTRDTGITPTMATTPPSSSDSKTWIIVGVVAGVVVVVAVAVGVAVYVYKKRKCKKRDSKVHNKGSQGEAGGNVQGEGYVEVNKGYEERANRPSGGGKTSSVPPVLYDAAQTSSRGAVKGPPLPQYAAVDKSKKKPKKPKPGELQYAELAEFSHGQGGQRSSLSPTNRPTDTQYADVNAM